MLFVTTRILALTLSYNSFWGGEGGKGGDCQILNQRLDHPGAILEVIALGIEKRGERGGLSSLPPPLLFFSSPQFPQYGTAKIASSSFYKIVTFLFVTIRHRNNFYSCRS